MSAVEPTQPVPALKVEVAARRLNIGKSTLYAAVLRGEVPAIRIGGAVRIPAGWVERVLREGYAPPANVRSITGGRRP